MAGSCRYESSKRPLQWVNVVYNGLGPLIHDLHCYLALDRSARLLTVSCAHQWPIVRREISLRTSSSLFHCVSLRFLLCYDPNYVSAISLGSASAYLCAFYFSQHSLDGV
jgi:hypothetical protein